MSKSYKLTPQDVLFFRDARPMEASDAGLGANWPRPDQLNHAIRSACLAAWPGKQVWEPETRETDGRFPDFLTAGPFPCRGKDVFLPCPLDWNMEVVPVADTDLPAPLTHGFLPVQEGKVSLPRWIAPRDYLAYLKGACPAKPEDPKLYAADRSIGIGLDAATGTTVEGAFYQAEYLRLDPDVGMLFWTDGTDLLEQAGAPRAVPFGGQRRMCHVESAETPRLPLVEITTRYLRWTLVTPALFNAGWRPGWVAEDGRVMLPRPCEGRRPGESRQAWRARLNAAGRFDVRLVAARIGKPEAFSGWRLAHGVQAPKPTVLAVPAGSSYVFDCGSPAEARALAAVLAAPARRSDLCGEQGFGMGLCSSIEIK